MFAIKGECRGDFDHRGGLCRSRRRNPDRSAALSGSEHRRRHGVAEPARCRLPSRSRPAATVPTRPCQECPRMTAGDALGNGRRIRARQRCRGRQCQRRSWRSLPMLLSARVRRRPPRLKSRTAERCLTLGSQKINLYAVANGIGTEPLGCHPARTCSNRATAPLVVERIAA